MEDQTKNPSAQPIPTTVPSVSVGTKESGNYVEQVNEKPVVSSEINQFVEHSEPDVPSEPKIGINPSGHLATVNKEPNSTHLPMTEKEIEDVLKQNSIKDNFSGPEFQKDVDEKYVYITNSVKFEATLLQKITLKARELLSRIKLSPKPI